MFENHQLDQYSILEENIMHEMAQSQCVDQKSSKAEWNPGGEVRVEPQEWSMWRLRRSSEKEGGDAKWKD